MMITSRSLLAVVLLSSFQDAHAFTLQKSHSHSTAIWMNNNNNIVDDEAQLNNEHNNHIISRRSALLRSSFSAISAASILSSNPTSSQAQAVDDLYPKVHVSATWNAIDGLNSLDSEKKIVAFDQNAYKAMRDDKSRTPLFEKAIIKSLNSAPGGPESMTVLDLGTGPFALFSIIAAQNGAGKVYAIEANKEAARAARDTISKLGYDDIITVMEGFSTDVTLPTKADLIIAEIIGSVATEEGAYATILDAHKRLAKNPNDAGSWIPSRIQTYMSPASYTLHNLFQPPDFDWSKLDGQPVRFNCRDEGLQILSDPVLVEDISFADIEKDSSSAGKFRKQLSFTIDGERMEDNVSSLYDELRNGRLSKPEAEKMAKATGQSLSGIALWPRLILDKEEVIQVNSRSYPKGNHQRSHWQTVLPIFNPTPVPVKAGDEVIVTVDFDVSDKVLQAPVYKLEGDIINKSS